MTSKLVHRDWFIVQTVGEPRSSSASGERKASFSILHRFGYVSLSLAGQPHGPRPRFSAGWLVVALAPSCPSAPAPGQRPGARPVRVAVWEGCHWPSPCFWSPVRPRDDLGQNWGGWGVCSLLLPLLSRPLLSASPLKVYSSHHGPAVPSLFLGEEPMFCAASLSLNQSTPFNEVLPSEVERCFLIWASEWPCEVSRLTSAPASLPDLQRRDSRFREGVELVFIKQKCDFCGTLGLGSKGPGFKLRPCYWLAHLPLLVLGTILSLSFLRKCIKWE